MDLVEEMRFCGPIFAVAKELESNMETVNVNGGAIALGHPIGASGAEFCYLFMKCKEEMSRKGGHIVIGGGRVLPP